MFTKGPWKILKYASGQYSIMAPILESDMPICLVAILKADSRENADEGANARLIASAPEMYEALLAYIEKTKPLSEVRMDIYKLLRHIEGDV